LSSCSTITATLNKDIDHFSVLIDCSPQVVLFAVYLDKYLIKIKRIAKSDIPTPMKLMHHKRVDS